MNDNDQRSSRASVHYVGLLAVLGLVGTFTLLALDRAPDTVAIFTGLAGGAIGAVCALATTRSRQDGSPQSTPPIAPDAPPSS